MTPPWTLKAWLCRSAKIVSCFLKGCLPCFRSPRILSILAYWAAGFLGNMTVNHNHQGCFLHPCVAGWYSLIFTFMRNPPPRFMAVVEKIVCTSCCESCAPLLWAIFITDWRNSWGDFVCQVCINIAALTSAHGVVSQIVSCPTNIALINFPQVPMNQSFNSLISAAGSQWLHILLDSTKEVPILIALPLSA